MTDGTEINSTETSAATGGSDSDGTADGAELDRGSDQTNGTDEAPAPTGDGDGDGVDDARETTLVTESQDADTTTTV